MKRYIDKETGEKKAFGNLQVYAEAENTNERQFLGNFDSFKQILEYYEDYTPAEPYIKDEKNRKLVRAWLEANDLDGATFHTSSHFFHYWNLRGFNDNGQGVDIDFFLTGEGIPNLIDGKYYTKFELCGEEEE